MNVLSVFDGMACGLEALKRAGIKVDKYYASEIDKYAIKIAKKNHPEIIHLGDVKTFDVESLPKIDLLIGGSPCQGFSNAGKGLNFEDPRSKLFFVYVYILQCLREKNPEIKFLLENVKMKKEWQDVISGYMGVQPIQINSALVSAQNRVRLYWTNIEGISQPKDRGIFLKDIIVDGDVDRQKSYTIDANYFKGGNPRSYFEDGKRQLVFEHQSQKRAMVKCARMVGRRLDENGTRKDYSDIPAVQRLEPREDGKTGAITTVQKDNLLVFVGGLEEGRRLDDGKNLSRNYREGYRVYSAEGKSSALGAQPKGGPGGYTGLYQVGMASDVKGKDQWRRVYSPQGKSPTLVGSGGGHHEPKISLDDVYYRKLYPLECERLQTLPDDYTAGVSNTQRYKMLGNGWTVEVIRHIFSHLTP